METVETLQTVNNQTGQLVKNRDGKIGLAFSKTIALSVKCAKHPYMVSIFVLLALAPLSFSQPNLFFPHLLGGEKKSYW